jgi:hypothetical protein
MIWLPVKQMTAASIVKAQVHMQCGPGNFTERGAQYLQGENLEVVWAEFSTLRLTVLFQNNITEWHVNSLF